MATNSAGLIDGNLHELLEEAVDLRNLHITYKFGRDKRRIIFHSGPPNSGKTHDAIEDFVKAASGIYCCPLRLLAQEVAQKSKSKGISCDMITGEQTILANPPQKSSHKACTVQLADMDQRYDVAIIDEIQMISDPQNGWAFTRALLGLNARTLLLCGDECALSLVSKLANKCGESVERRRHIRPNNLQYMTVPLGSRGNLKNVKEGDCIVCFSKRKVREVARQVENQGKKSAIIYGSLPPETKKSQIENFNSADSQKKVLVATDAIGMGLNAQIKRVIFYDLYKHSRDRDGELRRRQLTPLEFQQISGRAAREFSRYGQGYVMVAFSSMVDTMIELKDTPIPDLETAGIRPPVESIELFSSVMDQLSPGLEFSELLDRYLQKLRIDESLYFLCTIEDMKQLSNSFKDIPLKTKDRYNFCCAPIQHSSATQKETLVNMVLSYSQEKVLDAEWMKSQIGWTKIHDMKIFEMSQLEIFEDIYSTLSLYNWMNNKYPLLFPDVETVNGMSDLIVQKITDAIDNISNIRDTILRNQTRKRKFNRRLEDESEFSEQEESLTDNFLLDFVD